MFTGIVEGIGIVKNITRIQSGITLTINANNNILENTKIGDSIAVNGVCLTAVKIDNSSFCVDVSFETINKSNIGKLHINEHVNLERALRFSDRLSGHIVLGHIDSTSKILTIKKNGAFYLLRIACSEFIYKHCVDKGSISIDGISLTISNLQRSFLEVAVIPHTFENTNLKYKRPQDEVNIELDIIGKYIEKIVNGKTKDIDESFLKENGFIS